MNTELSLQGANERSGIFEEGENTNSCRLPAHLLSPLTSPAKCTERSILMDHSAISNTGGTTCQNGMFHALIS